MVKGFVSCLYFLLLFLFSAFFSASETAIVSLNRARLKARARKGDKIAQVLLELLKKPERTLSTILIGNNLVNVLLSSLATVIAVRVIGPYGVLYSTILVTISLLIFSEITPKTIAAYHPERVSYIVGLPLLILDRLFTPITWFTGVLARKIADISGGTKTFPLHILEEIKEMVSMGEAKEFTDVAVLYNFLSFQEIKVENVMVPRNKVEFLDLKDDPQKALFFILEKGYRHIPVVNGSLDNLEGMLDTRKFLRDFARGIKNLTLKNYIETPFYIPELISLSKAFSMLLKEGKEVGVVVDEYGGVSGLLLLKDILNELAGKEEEEVKKLPDGSFIVNGTTPLKDIEEALSVTLPPENKQKPISAYILEEEGEIPKENEVAILWDILEVTVVEASRKEIKKLRIKLLEK